MMRLFRKLFCGGEREPAPPLTEQDYAEATTDNLIRDHTEGRKELEQSIARSNEITDDLTDMASKKLDEIKRALEHVRSARRDADDAAELLRQIVEGPS